jgi:2,5-diamino-6-(ribosylamino)-4(3H)-pyrimidinone 5'-phosphate reductase
MEANTEIYASLDFPPAPADRPYIYINMVSTIDGKTVSGRREETVLDLGSKVDHAVMDRLEGAADAIVLGAGSARANPSSWNPKAGVRIVVTESGAVPWEAQYFTGGRAFAASSERASFEAPDHVERLRTGSAGLDLALLLRHLRRGLGVERLHLMGGSELNASFLSLDLVDELFLTIAPKVKLGRDVPTYAGGEPLAREEMLQFRLLEHHAAGDEVFLRYRRRGVGR